MSNEQTVQRYRARWVAPPERNSLIHGTTGWVERSEYSSREAGVNVYLFTPDNDLGEGYYCYDGDFEPVARMTLNLI